MNISRRDAVKELIQAKGEVHIRDLEQHFPDVSGMTLRRDLAYLESKGQIVRTRGGARTITRTPTLREDLFSLRATENMEAKMKIADKAVKLVETGRSIFIDSGTTTMCLATLLPDESFSILTSGPNIGLELLKNNNPSITLVGGVLSKNNLSTSGASSIDLIRNINIDIAFLATSGFSLKSGFTIGSYSESETKKAAIKKAGKVILLMDQSKIDRNMPYTFCGLKDIDILITDSVLPEPILKACEKFGVQVL